MSDDALVPSESATPLDELAAGLQGLRASAGDPSYAELAQRITLRREAQGVSPDRARVARSTVYDVFRPGRRRVDLKLVGEVLSALNLDDGTIRHWEQAARRAVAATTPSGDPMPQPVKPSPGPEPEPEPGPTTLAWSGGVIAAIVIASVLVNTGGRGLVTLLELRLHLDMVGTAIAAVLVGPWWAVLVAVVTNVVGVAVSGSSSLPFILVNVAGALLWGYGVRRWRLGQSAARFLALSVGVAFACSVVAAPILLFVYDGYVGHASEGVTDRLLSVTHALVFSVFSANLLTSLADKLISGSVALACAEAIPQYSAAYGLRSPRRPLRPLSLSRVRGLEARA